jgi:hypothetical protein
MPSYTNISKGTKFFFSIGCNTAGDHIGIHQMIPQKEAR